MTDEIKSVSQAVEMLLSRGFSDVWSSATDRSKLPEAIYPMGLWFRGQANADWKLRPGVFRVGKNDADPGVYVDETSTFHHFKLRQPRFHAECQSTFDWLALMPHHGLPTRLLDWSESILVGLFFAVSDEGSARSPGRLFALDARKLNQHCGFDMPGPELAIPEEFDTVLRSEMAVANRRSKLLLKESVSRAGVQYPPRFRGKGLACILDLIKSEDGDAIRRLQSPIGVFPNRMHGRMIFQSSMFTLHGGKRIWDRDGISEDLLPPPVHLEHLADEARDERFLRSYLIPEEDKRIILRDLRCLGIHEGSLFPEADFQSRFVKKYWTFDLKEGKGDAG